MLKDKNIILGMINREETCSNAAHLFHKIEDNEANYKNKLRN